MALTGRDALEIFFTCLCVYAIYSIAHIESYDATCSCVQIGDMCNVTCIVDEHNTTISDMIVYDSYGYSLVPAIANNRNILRISSRYIVFLKNVMIACVYAFSYCVIRLSLFWYKSKTEHEQVGEVYIVNKSV